MVKTLTWFYVIKINVFPLVKVYKFFKNGSTDSIAAFGPIAAMTLKGNLKESTKANESVDPKVC